MRNRFVPSVLATACGLLGSVGSSDASAAVLDFPSTFSAQYGDIPGVLDVGYSYLATSGATGLLGWWGAGYDELNGVAWSTVSAPGTLARISLTPLGGQQSVHLQSLQLGSWEVTGAGRTETLNIYRIGNPVPAFSFSGTIGRNNLSTLFSPDLTSSTGLLIEWTNPWWTAIDNVRFDLPSAVPEPGAVWLMLLGLGVFAGWRFANQRAGETS